MLHRLKKYRRIYMIAVILIAVSLVVIFYHRHDNNRSRGQCPICKTAKDLSNSKTLQPFCLVLPEMADSFQTVDVFTPECVPLLTTHDSRAPPCPKSFCC